MSDKKMEQPAASPSSGASHFPAGLILLAGAAAAFVFRHDSGPQHPMPPEPVDALVRRAQAPAETYDHATTQLLGYVESDVPRGTDARPQVRTAAKIDQTSGWTEFDSSSNGTSSQLGTPWNAAPPSLSPTFRGGDSQGRPAVNHGSAVSPAASPTARFASSGSAPWATMRPYEASSISGESSAALSSTPANAVRHHAVRDGDTLAQLADRYYGDARRYREIYQANTHVLTDPELLPIGATLVIPAYDPRVVRPVEEPPAARLVPQMMFRQP